MDIQEVQQKEGQGIKDYMATPSCHQKELEDVGEKDNAGKNHKS